MKKIFIILNLFCSLYVTAQTNSDKRVRETIELFFKGLNAKDTIIISKTIGLDLEIRTISQQKKPSVLEKVSYKDFLERLAEAPKELSIEERVSSYEIKVDGDLATAWMPYSFFINGDFSHKGVNSFTLFNDNGTWKIISIIYTIRNED